MNNAFQSRRCIWACFLLCFGAVGVSFASALPGVDGQQHLGVASCAGSNCHGATTPHAQSPVLQNEYFIWSREDRHAQSYKSLFTAKSVRMGERLGLVPHESPRCLNCHADNVPQEQRGPRFRLSDGVGCEACHGGAENWLPKHVETNASHASNLAAGMYPTHNPVERGRLCLSCHLGDDQHVIDHQIMGAGHPELGFELDTFTAIQPAHFTVDKDYLQRKGAHSSVQTWAAGQMVAAQRYLEELSGPRLQQGLFPELVFFDCYACHHSLSEDRWSHGAAPGLGPGRVRLHSVNLSLVGIILAAIEPSAHAAYAAQLSQLHVASNESVSALREKAGRMARTLAKITQRHSEHDYSAAQAWDLMRGVSEYGLSTPDFNLAEQSAMALEAIFLSIQATGEVDAQRSKAIRSRLDRAYGLTNRVDDYNATAYRAILADLRRHFPG